MTEYVDCLAGFLDELAIGAAHVCGLSWGGVLAQEFYGRYRDRVRSLVLADTYAGWRGSLGEATAEERRASCLRDSERPARDWIPAWIPGLFTPAATAEARAGVRGYHARLPSQWIDDSLRLRNVGPLLPYHSHVDPGTVVSALNHMIDDVNNGKAVFYDFHTEEEKKEQPTKSNTGLFFFRGKPGAPFAVISPGGGFSYVGSVHEGFPYALAISKHGFNAFVLRYRAGSGGAVATRDLAAAISYVSRNAKMLGVGTEAYSLWGSSAGARMAAAIGSHGVASFGGDILPKPSAVVMAYTVHSEYSADEPSTFVVVGEHDAIAPPSVMARRVAALRKAGTEEEFHQYSGLGHGFGPGTGTRCRRMARPRHPILGEVHQTKYSALAWMPCRTVFLPDSPVHSVQLRPEARMQTQDVTRVLSDA